MIIRNAIQCKKCKVEIESKEINDVVRCKCKSVGVSGGTSYLYRSGNSSDYVELSTHEHKGKRHQWPW